MTVGRYAVGLAALLLVCGSMAAAAHALRARLLGDWTGAPARLAEFVLGLALLIAILEALGAAGLFELGPIVVACLAAGAVAWSTRPPPASPGDPGPRPHRVELAVALVAAGAVLAEWAVPTLSSYDTGIHSFDSLWYHLPWAASFAQSGWVTTLHFTDVEYLTPFYPATAEMVHGLGIVLLGRDTLSPALNLGWLALTLLAAWCIGARRGLGPHALTGAALAVATPMLRGSQAGTAANDIPGVFFLLAAVALVLYADEAPAALVLAAVAAGLAVAVKLSLLAPVLALTVAVVVSRRGDTATWIGAAFLAGGYWYVRNLVAVGNPLPWFKLGIFTTPAAPLQQHTGFAIVHYASDTGVWSRFFEPGLAAGLGPWWVAVVAVAVLGPALCLARRPSRALGFVALAALAAYLLTPETAAGPAGDPSGFAFNLRYAAPGLTLALAVAPLAPGLSGRRARCVALAGLALLLAVALAEPRLWRGGYAGGAVVAAVGVLVALGAAVALARAPRAWRARMAVAAAGLAALAVAGYAGQRHYLRGRYAYRPGVSSLASLWAWARSVHNARIALVGTFGGFFSYPLYGLDDSNRVQYVAARGPHGSFTPILTCRAWRAALNDGRYRYVVTTPGRDPWHPHGLQPSPEGSWTQGPGARVVLKRLAHGQAISVFELTGPLSASGCPA